MHTRRLGLVAAAASRIALAVAVPAVPGVPDVPLPLPGPAQTGTAPAASPAAATSGPGIQLPVPSPVVAVVHDVVGALPAPVPAAVQEVVADAPAPLANALTPILFAGPAPPTPPGPGGHVQPPPTNTTPVPGAGGGVLPSTGDPALTDQPGTAAPGLAVLKSASPPVLAYPVAATVPIPPAVAPAAGLPEVVLPPGPEGQRLALALIFLPLLAATWLLVATRLWRRGWTLARARRRASLAEQLGLAPADLAQISDRVMGRLRDHVVFDDLTGVMRRAAGMAALEREAARARRSGEPLSVVFVDVDGLKATNDSDGHEAGDRMLRRFAYLLRDRLRESDLVFRFGGDEFVVVLPGTQESAAADFIEQIRVRGDAIGLAFSAGTAQISAQETAATVLDRADRALYVEKRQRRRHRPSAVKHVEAGTTVGSR